MLRDIHLYHLIKESQLFEKVHYVLSYNLDSKIDIFVRLRICTLTIIHFFKELLSPKAGKALLYLLLSSMPDRPDPICSYENSVY